MRISLARAVVVMLCVSNGAAVAQRYSPGASDTEIRLGQTVPLSGPVSVWQVWWGRRRLHISRRSIGLAASMAGR